MRRSILFSGTFLFCLFVFAMSANAHPCKKQSRNKATGRYEKAAVVKTDAVGTGLGFHTKDAPLGVRFGLSDDISLDLAAGFSSADFGDRTTFDVGLPYTLKEWSCVRALLRPGVLYSTCDVPLGDRNTTTLSLELEGEAFLCRQISVSAAFGVAHESVDLPGASENVTRTYTTGGEFTRVGMHLYLFR